MLGRVPLDAVARIAEEHCGVAANLSSKSLTAKVYSSISYLNANNHPVSYACACKRVCPKAGRHAFG